MMFIKSSEKGQALILIALAAVGLFAFSALAIDGSMAFSDKRHAQNAADTAALAGALAHARGGSITTTAEARATSNGYDGGDMSDVTVEVADSPSGVCPANTAGKDITVTIVSYVDTSFAKVIGRNQIANAVTATARSCGSFYGPPFDGHAIVSLAPSGIGFDANGTPDWVITGGGIFSNSSSSPAVACGGAAEITAPSVTVVGGTDIGSCSTVGSTDDDAPQLTFSEYSMMLPRKPACNGTATFSAGRYHPQAGADGSKFYLSSGDADKDFAPGLYCIMDTTVGPYHGQITGSEVTFYVPSATFSLKFDGSGNSFNASAPTSGEYTGVLMYMAPQVDANGNLLNTQALDLRGNGDQDTVGSIIAPSADVTMFGNSEDDATINSQIIAYQVDAGGNANIDLTYNANDNYQALLPCVLTLIE